MARSDVELIKIDDLRKKLDFLQENIKILSERVSALEFKNIVR